jgi:hypothetical protein
MIKNILNNIKTNTRWSSSRVRLFAIAFLVLLGFYGSIFYIVKSFGANRAYAFSRPSLIEMNDAAKQHYAEDLKKLLIKKPEQIRMLLGQDILLVMDKPSMQRQDDMISMWQFRSSECVLDIYFKPAEEWEYAPVMHYELRKRQKAYFIKSDEVSELDNQKDCVKSLLTPAPQKEISDI